MRELPESIKFRFTTPAGESDTVGFSLDCFDMHQDRGKDEPVSCISFSYGPWDLDKRGVPEDPIDCELYEKYGPDRLLISMDSSDGLIYLTPRVAKAILTILQQFIK